MKEVRELSALLSIAFGGALVTAHYAIWPSFACFLFSLTFAISGLIRASVAYMKAEASNG